MKVKTCSFNALTSNEVFVIEESIAAKSNGYSIRHQDSYSSPS